MQSTKEMSIEESKPLSTIPNSPAFQLNNSPSLSNFQMPNTITLMDLDAAQEAVRELEEHMGGGNNSEMASPVKPSLHLKVISDGKNKDLEIPDIDDNRMASKHNNKALNSTTVT